MPAGAERFQAAGPRPPSRRAGDWKRWDPYLAERQRGTVREDHSEYGSCGDYLPHDHARSRASHENLAASGRPRAGGRSPAAAGGAHTRTTRCLTR